MNHLSIVSKKILIKTFQEDAKIHKTILVILNIGMNV